MDTAPAAPAAPGALRLSLMLAYPLLCHVASVAQPPQAGIWSATTLWLLLAWCLLDALWAGSRWAVGLLVAAAAGLGWLAGSPWAWLLLLTPPVVFPLWVAWLFARTLLAGRQPLVARIVHAVHASAGMPVEPALERYVRRLTAAWAAVLVLLAVLNLVLAMSVVPDGPLAMAGITPWWPVSHTTWSWLANVVNWGLLGGFALVEYAWRSWRFPQRPYRDMAGFARALAALGPVFWRDLLR